MFETGIKVIDLLEALRARAARSDVFGGAGVGKTILIMEMINRVATAARWCVGVRWGRRAHARGQRPLVGDARSGVIEKTAVDLRPDGRAARRAIRGRAVGAHDGRVLPRRQEPRRTALHRQHLPVRPGGLGGVDAARTYAVRSGVPADARRRDGRAPGAHHVHEGPLDHVAAGGVRAGRRLHRPGAVHRRSRTSTRRPSSRVAIAGAGHLPGG